jgi:hypothetical protein
LATGLGSILTSLCASFFLSFSFFVFVVVQVHIFNSEKMARSTSFMVLCFVVLAFALGLAQGAYWTEPNVPPCNITSLVCPNLYDTCSGWSHCKQQVPTTMDSCTLYLQRLSVPAGHHFLVRALVVVSVSFLLSASQGNQAVS